MAALRPSWFYTWGAILPATAPPGVEFVPMVWWGRSQEQVRAVVEDVRALQDAGVATALLGFNEPDVPAQANMTVEGALALWPELQVDGLRLGSPATSRAGSTWWMGRFMAGVAAAETGDGDSVNGQVSHRVDFVAVHYYGAPNVGAFIRFLYKSHQAHARPLWVTEFGVADWEAGEDHGSNRYTPRQVAAFMREVLPLLDALPFVERYAWFPFLQADPAGHPSALFTPDNEMTELGEIYANHCQRGASALRRLI